MLPELSLSSLEYFVCFEVKNNFSYRLTLAIGIWIFPDNNDCHCEWSCEARPKQTGARFLTIFGTSSVIPFFLIWLPRSKRPRNDGLCKASICLSPDLVLVIQRRGCSFLYSRGVSFSPPRPQIPSPFLLASSCALLNSSIYLTFGGKVKSIA